MAKQEKLVGTLDHPVRTMRNAIKFASRDATRPILCAVHLDERGDVVATDSYRMFASGMWGGPTVNIDYATAYDISKCKLKGNDTAEIEVVGTDVTVRMGDGTEIKGATVEGKYPKYEVLFGGKHNTVAYVNVKEALPVLKEHARNKRNVTVEVANRDLYIYGMGEPEPAYRKEKECDGEDVRIGFNAAYLRDCLQAMGEFAEIRIESPLKPAVITWNEGTDVLLMPVRLDGGAKEPKVKKGWKEAPKAPEPKTDERIGSLKGERVCITGTLPGMARSEAFTRLKLAGGISCEKFSGKVTMFVIAANAGRDKREKAERAIAKGQKVRIVSGTEFVRALNEQGKTAGERKQEEHMAKKQGKKEGVNRDGLAELLYALAIDRAAKEPDNRLTEGNASPNSATYVWRLQKDGRLKHEGFGNYTSWYLDGEFVTCIERRYSARKIHLHYPEIKPAAHRDDVVMKRRTEQKLAEHGVKADVKVAEVADGVTAITVEPPKNAPKPAKKQAPKPPAKPKKVEEDVEMKKRIEELEAELKATRKELDEVWKENATLKAKPQAPKVEQAAAVVSLESMTKWCEGKGLIASQKREGACIWVEGDSKPYADELKEMGFRFAKKRKSWYFPAA